MLEVRGLAVFHGRVQALWGLDLGVAPGQLVAVIGPNGAGKSSLLAGIMGLLPTKAQGQPPALSFQGQALDGLATEERARLGLTLVPEGGRVFPEMTCLDNLKLGAYLLDAPGQLKTRLDEVLALFPRLAERRRQRAATLSGGERQMLALGRALMGRPKLLLLDEPSLGLHPLMATNLFEAIAAINAQGTAILLVEQKVGQALALAHQAHVLENGRLALSGPGPELLRNPHVRRAYLAI